MSSTRILLVEDDPDICRFVSAALASQGHDVTSVATLRDADASLQTRPADMVVLDLGLPDGDGRQLLASLRGWSSMPVLVLSARVGEVDKIEALDAGADDYLTKPFTVGELQARVRAMLRRAQMGPQDEQPVHRFGQVEVDLAHRQVLRAGAPVKLTPIEFKLLSTLIHHAGKVLTHRQLLREVWGPGHTEHSHYLRVYVGHLRHKLEEDPTQPRHLLTELGVGYRFVHES
jgi:two-component system, OmpR family, KDP operon response regulator KdpE